MDTTQNPLHVVYVVTSQGWDVYSLMTQASILSLKHWNPAARVTLVCDPQTKSALSEKEDPLIPLTDHLLSFPTPHTPQVFRNRFLKTTIGSRIDGPFLYLDSDTLVRENLDSMLTEIQAADISASVNHSQGNKENQECRDHSKQVDQHHWLRPCHGFYNSGVIWFSGTPASKNFAEHWHALWNISAASGMHFDQPAFNAAIAKNIAEFKPLPIPYNAQIKSNPACAESAAIWHYYASSRHKCGCKSVVAIEKMVFTMSPGQLLNPNAIIAHAEDNYPWRMKSSLDRWVIRRISETSRPVSKAAKCWLHGQRMRAIRKKIVSLLSN